MKLHEYQAKSLLKRYGILVPSGGVARSATEAVEIAKALGTGPWMLKAQILAGGRGKAGGILRADSLDDVKEKMAHLLGTHLVTEQTSLQGECIEHVYLEPWIAIEKERYLSFFIDQNGIMLLAKKAGGIHVEGGQSLLKLPVEKLKESSQILKVQTYLGFESSKAFISLLSDLEKLFCDLDAELLEINPLVLTQDQQLMALDAKLIIDDNALFRQPDLLQMGFSSHASLDPSLGMNYVKLEGTIGCLVNGAGLAMATMDLIKAHGGNPANFLDIGGTATQRQIKEAIQFLGKDPQVKTIFVNIFGGIIQCDVVAKGILDGISCISTPIFVRFQGTHAIKGKEILKNTSVQVIEDLNEIGFYLGKEVC